MSDGFWQGLRGLVAAGQLRALDYQFGRFMAGQGADLPLALAAVLVSAELQQGNVCLPLARFSAPARHWPEALLPLIERYLPAGRLAPDGVLLGEGATATPLVLQHQRLYLYRYWRYEVQVSAALQQRAAAVELDTAVLREAIGELFPPQDAEVDWQKVAAAVAVQRRFAVISGGPGTGKTTTVIKLLALYVRQLLAQGREPVIRLAAPTGKAAARLAESIAATRARLGLAPEIDRLIPDATSTLHRLLGVIPDSHRFRHDQSNPLHLNLLVVDEASMVDLPMMARLLDALPASARLILIGDRDQLASVEAGSVLADICSWPGAPGYSAAQAAQLGALCDLAPALLQQDYRAPIADSVAQLRRSYRFHENSGIGHLARAVNAGDPPAALAVLQAGWADILFRPLDAQASGALIAQCVAGYRPYLQAAMGGEAPGRVLRQFNEMQLLCALREGAYGVSGLNEAIRRALAGAGLVKGDGLWYAGRPVIVTRNDPALELYNGDVGIALPDEAGRLKVWFEQGGQCRAVLPSRLPDHETVFAMTVHKSQGSEFRRTLLLLPPGDKALLSRELVYTGITRAKERFELYATATAFVQAVGRRTERAGGLRIRLWEGAGASCAPAPPEEI